MDAVGVPRAEIARRLSLSRNTVAKYADMADMSPAAPEARPRARRALGPEDAAWIDAAPRPTWEPRASSATPRSGVLRPAGRGEGLRGLLLHGPAPRARLARRAPGRRGDEGYLELEWAPAPRRSTSAASRPTWPASASRSSCSSSRCRTQTPAARTPGLHVAALGVHVRGPLADRAGRARAGGARARQRHRGGQDVARGGDGVPPVLLFRAHYRCASRYCNPYSGNEKGSVENAVGFIRRTCSSPCRRSGPSRS